MIDDSTKDASAKPIAPDTSSNEANESISDDAIPRRDFLRVAGASAGLFMAGGAALPTPAPTVSAKATRSVRSASASPEVVVIGAGGWGSFTAMNLRKRGVNVRLVDAYGPGNARSTSGDETRGVRSSYGDRPGIQGETWTLWARESMKLWTAFDDEWGKEFRMNLFHVTGDLIMRTEWDNFQLRTKVWWDKHKIPYSILNPDDVRKSFPVISMDDITAVLYEPDAGVVRARRGAQAAASVFERLGGTIVIGRATPGKVSGGKLEEITLDTGATLRADTFVFAVGPWMGKTFPTLLGKKTRVPIGQVVYYGTPVGDERFTYPNLPSFNFPGVTGWAALPVDNRGFRVRGNERAPGAPGGPPGTVAAGGRGAGGGRGQQQDVPPAQQDPDTSDRWVNQAALDGSRRFVTHRFPLLKNAPVSQTHACHYESTSSGNYIIDTHPDMANAWIVAGGNSEGFKMCPKIGEYASGRILGTEKNAALIKAYKIPEKEYEPPAPRPQPADTTRHAPPPDFDEE
jgi:sarcosine oxidase